MAEAVVEIAERVLRGNWLEGERDGTGFAYTRPSPTRYPWQWYWDSCFAAIVWRRFDPSRSRRELESLLAAQREDGFIGHTIFWDRPVSLTRLPFYNVASRRAFQTETIQPPLLAWAWRIAVGDPAAEPRIAAQVEWLARNRDLEGDGLLWIVQPDESGLDASPKFDEVWGRRANGRIGFPCWSGATAGSGSTRRGSATPAGRCSARSWSTRSGRSRCRRSAGPRRRRRSSTGSGTSARGLFVDEAQPGGVAARTLTWAALAPLALPDLPEEIGRRLVEEHLLSGASSRPRSRRPRSPRRAQLRAGRRPRPDPPLLARPDLGQLGLDGLDRPAPARLRGGGGAPRRGPFGAVEREGLREYYDPRDGTGLGAERLRLVGPGRRDGRPGRGARAICSGR